MSWEEPSWNKTLLYPHCSIGRRQPYGESTIAGITQHFIAVKVQLLHDPGCRQISDEHVSGPPGGRDEIRHLQDLQLLIFTPHVIENDSR